MPNFCCEKSVGSALRTGIGEILARKSARQTLLLAKLTFELKNGLNEFVRAVANHVAGGQT
jgi:hypothetical protein